MKESKPRKKVVVNQNIASRIKSARLESKVTQLELADFLNISEKQVAFYESGDVRVSAQTLKLIAEFLHKPVSYFYDNEHDILFKLEKKIDVLYEALLGPSSKGKSVDIESKIGLKDFLLLKGIDNKQTLADLELYFRFACERDGFNFDNIWHS